ncbi:phage terminase large subunit family protein [Paraburkholderia sp. BR10936]|uniref:phage terminase large subunit family protein n=1 Tax=Paraburkholderia sp. BR10936 TaxID=3236993 RepID=UPI0034D270AF
MTNLVPPPEMLPSEWAEANVKIPIGNAIPGPINFDNAPYQRGMLDAIKEPGVYRVDYMTGAQLGKTTVQQCATGFFIAHEPRSQIFVQPTQGDVQTFLETKLRPMLDANPKISRRMAKKRSREGVNNSRIISYIGGWLMFSWAGSPKTLRGRSAPITQADEVDGMDATPEGDPVELLAQRAATFGDQALSTRSSTPTIKGSSRIETGFLEGDQRRYHVPCPGCGEGQYLKWSNVHWSGRCSTGIHDAENDKGKEHDPHSARYTCEVCGSLWDDGQRIAAIRSAESKGFGWKAEKPFKGHASFHAPELLSTFRKLRDIVQSYLDKLAVNDLQSFVNVSLAETWEEKGDKADSNALMQRREQYRAQVPMGGVWLGAGIDAQVDRLEVQVVAFGLGEEAWHVDYRVLYGDPLGPDVWADLEDVLAETWQHETGVEMRIMGACMDTGGTNSYTQTAYDWLAGKTGRRIFGVKGVAGWGRGIVEKSQKKQSGKGSRKIDLYLVGVDEAKLITMRRLNQQSPGPGYIHFSEDCDNEYFDQLTAEKLVTRYVKGFPNRVWTKLDKARNEALDTFVYAYAALKILRPNLKRLDQRMREQAKHAVNVTYREVSRTPEPGAPEAPAQLDAEATAEATTAPAPVAPPASDEVKVFKHTVKRPEKARVERKPAQTENGGIEKSSRKFAGGKARKRGTWATKF